MNDYITPTLDPAVTLERINCLEFRINEIEERLNSIEK